MSNSDTKVAAIAFISAFFRLEQRIYGYRACEVFGRPFLDGCEPLRVIAMGFGSFDGALALERLATIALVEFETQGAVDRKSVG